MPQFMIKYGEEDHLLQIVNGKLRFAPSQTYVKIEEALHNRGQGDLLDGKMKIKVIGAELYDPDTKELKGKLPSCEFTISIGNVNNMPIFCVSQYGDEDMLDYESYNKYKIALSDEKLNCIKTDFPNATHALIIIEPDKFITDIEQIIDHQIVSDIIRYYDYDANPLQMFMYLTTGDDNTGILKNTPLSMTYKNRYRHLLCKHIDFARQQEYRFIGLDELITEPKFYPFTFTSRYVFVPISKLDRPLQINY